jgi:hypothetical protein
MIVLQVLIVFDIFQLDYCFYFLTHLTIFNKTVNYFLIESDIQYFERTLNNLKENSIS